jgi:hypothetical protein
MNTNLLQKCIVELQKDKPDLSYMRGILETLIVMAGVPTSSVSSIVLPPPTMMSSRQTTVEGLTEEEQEYHSKMTSGPVAPMRETDE